MSKLYYKAIIEHVQYEKCTEDEVAALLGTYERLVKRTATTAARKAWYHLEDCAMAKQQGVGRFTLTLERSLKKSTPNQWRGRFEYGGKRLEVVGALAK